MFAVRIVALLCLLPAGFSSPLPCEVLAKPLDHLDHHQLEGRWALVAAGVKNATLVEDFKIRDSTTIKFSYNNETSDLSLTRMFRYGECKYLNFNILLQGSTFSATQVNLTVTALHTSCPDCLVFRFDAGVADIVRVTMLSKRRELEQKEMEEFEAQLKCLMMPPALLADPSKELCPDQSATEPAAQ